jgi:transcription elongation factor B subunit 1
VVLEKVVEYFYYYRKYRNKAHVPDMDFPVELCLQILVAADYFGLGP